MHLEGEAIINLARQRIGSINWNDVQHLNLQGITTYCGRQPVAAIIVGLVALLAVLPVMLGTALLVLSLMTFIFMSLGIVMVSMMIILTILFMGFALFGLGCYLNHLKTSQQRQFVHSD